MQPPPNPTRIAADASGRNNWYPYYAGFSPAFAQWIIREAGLSAEALVADPWNGGGTTTWAANSLGLRTWGGDLNPAMILVAKAKLLDAKNCASLGTLARRIVRDATENESAKTEESDPLLPWVGSSDCVRLRALEKSVRAHVVPEAGGFEPVNQVSELSQIASFYYLALFRLARQVAKLTKASNPTWLGKPLADSTTTRAGLTVEERFLAIVDTLVFSAGEELRDSDSCRAALCVADSTALPLEADCVDLVLSSPPYCTRIDYAIATSIELAVLRASPQKLDGIRRMLMGTTTVPKDAGQVDPRWGEACLQFLDHVRIHPSHASSVYYYKSHVQYFRQLYLSLEEIARVLKKGARAALVVQDSYDKDVHNDLAVITLQMASSLGFKTVSRTDFKKVRSMRAVHPSRAKYGRKPAPVESVLLLNKTS